MTEPTEPRTAGEWLESLKVATVAYGHGFYKAERIITLPELKRIMLASEKRGIAEAVRITSSIPVSANTTKGREYMKATLRIVIRELKTATTQLPEGEGK